MDRTEIDKKEWVMGDMVSVRLPMNKRSTELDSLALTKVLSNENNGK